MISDFNLVDTCFEIPYYRQKLIYNLQAVITNLVKMNESNEHYIYDKLVDNLSSHVSQSLATFIHDIGCINNFKLIIVNNHNTEPPRLHIVGDKYHFENHIYTHDYSFFYKGPIFVGPHEDTNIDDLLRQLPLSIPHIMEEVIGKEVHANKDIVVVVPRRTIWTSISNWQNLIQQQLTISLERELLIKNSGTSLIGSAAITNAL